MIILNRFPDAYEDIAAIIGVVITSSFFAFALSESSLWPTYG